MSSTKVIFTYKRKRLSSCSGISHVEVCPEFTSDFHVDTHQGATKGRSESQEQDLKFLNCVNCDNVDNLVNCKNCLKPYNTKCTESCFKHICHAERLSSTCSSPQVHKLSVFKETNSVEDSDTTNTKETVLGSYELSGDRTITENISREVGNIRSSMTKAVDSCSPHVDKYVLGASVSQSVEKDTDSPSKQSYLCNFEIVKAKATAPLLTFSRRLKRKADANSMVMFSELPIREGSAIIEEGKSMGIHPCSSEMTSSHGKCVKESLDLKDSNDLDTRNVLCQGREEMNSKETGDSPCPCDRSCSEIVDMDYFREKSSEKDLNVDISPVTEPTATKTLETFASLFPDVVETSNISKENVRYSSNDGTVLPFCDTDKTDDQRVLHQLQASDGESRLTSNGLDSTIAIRIAERKDSSGAFVIDCNLIPDLLGQVSGTGHHSSIMVKTHEDAMQQGHLKTRGLELFGPTGVQVNNSLLQLPEDACASVKGETKPKIKCLQLFSADDLFSPASTDSEVLCSKAEQNSTFALGSEKDRLERSSSNGSAFLGLSLPSEPLLGQSSKHGFMPPFQDKNVRTREFIQNPAVHPSFIDHASLAFRHRKLLESINTKATALRGNRNISLDNFEPCPTMWTEEELDSLWIGIRRHGRGNWHAMLLDPRLHFAPWRVARDLALQWEQEQVKLLSGQHMLQGRYVKPPDPYNLERDVGFLCSGTGLVRENVSADTRLSLGDVYAQKACSYFRSSPQSHGFKHVRKASCKVDNYSYGLFNNLQINDGPAMGFVTNNSFPHWLREPHVAPSRPMEPPMPLNPTLPQIGAIQLVHPFPAPSGTAYESRNLINNNGHSGLMAGGEVQPPSGLPIAGPSTRKQGMTDNPIVIDSDASSEETISDDHNIRS